VRTSIRRLVPALLGLVLLAGCSSQGLSGVQLPGGAGGDGYRLTIEFGNVLDLVPQAAVKSNDVTVGSVRSVTRKGWHAQVEVQVDKDVELPANAVASIRQTSLLGEKFVDLDAPTDKPATGRLRAGATIPLSRTSRNVEAEEVLGAMSLLLNGGSLEKLKTINDEVAKVFDGREPDVRDTLKQLDTFVGGLDDQKKQIVRAINALNTFSSQVAKQKNTVAKAVDALDPGLKVLDDQKKQLIDMLAAVKKLGTVGTRVVKESRQDLLANLKSLQPTLTQLVKSGDNLPKSVDQLLTYPFPPNVGGAIVGDYVNLHLTVDLNVTDILSNLLTSTPVGDQKGKVADQNGPVRDPNKTGSKSTTAQPGPTDDKGRQLPAGESNPRQGDLLSILLGGLTG
jgi:phospholipid/cholesterol/gamma-HCH transport system substrate-binding protein